MSMCLLQGTWKEKEATLMSNGRDTAQAVVVTADILMVGARAYQFDSFTINA